MRVTKWMDKNRMALLQAARDLWSNFCAWEAFYEEKLKVLGYMEERFANLATTQCVTKDKVKRRMDQGKAGTPLY